MMAKGDKLAEDKVWWDYITPKYKRRLRDLRRRHLRDRERAKGDSDGEA